MKNLRKKEAIKILTNAAKSYHTHLENKHFLIVYKTPKGYDYVTVGFRDFNFLHLTGVSTQLKAQIFYSACINGELSERDIDLNTNGKAQQKLSVLPYLHELLFNRCMVGISLNGGIFIDADYFVGNTKAFLSVGFREHKTVDIPVTLYNANVAQLTKPTYKVVAIFSKMYNENKFNECTYSDEINLSLLPEDIKQMVEAG